MDISVRETGTRRVSANTNAGSATGQSEQERLLGSVEMIDRLAHAMRLKSGLDLPHAYFVEQVKLQLSGSPAFDQSLAEPQSPAARRAANFQSAACFEAWAMRD